MGARAGAVVVSDECYVELGWDAEPVSILDPRVYGGSHEGVLAVHSLSKRSNLAGYRRASCSATRRSSASCSRCASTTGLMVPAPVQAATIAALGDDAHVAEQRERYARGATCLRSRPRGRGLPDRPLRGGPVPVGHARRGLLGHRALVAERGILVAPGRVLRGRRGPARARGAHRHRRRDRLGPPPAGSRAVTCVTDG